MLSKPIHEKFIPFLESTKAFYSGEPLTDMTDKEWDEWRITWRSEMGKDVLHFIDFEGHQSVEHPYDTPGLSQKLQIEGSLVEAIDEYFKDRVNPESGEYPQFFISPKYDGSSLIIYYKNGFLDRILTKSSDDFGFDQTYKLKNFVPLEVDPSIESIQCEALVSLEEGLGGRTRNKANGLINSKYMQDEVNELLTIRAFRVNFTDKQYDYNRLYSTLMSLEVIKDELSSRILFAPTTILTRDLIPSTDVMNISTSENFLVDGVVAYTEEDVIGFKFYYTEHADVILNKENWGYSDKEGYSPVAQFDPVEIQGAQIQRASFNGINKFMAFNVTEGSIVRIIKANSTIPKIIKVIKDAGWKSIETIKVWTRVINPEEFQSKYPDVKLYEENGEFFSLYYENELKSIPQVISEVDAIFNMKYTNTEEVYHSFEVEGIPAVVDSFPKCEFHNSEGELIGGCGTQMTYEKSVYGNVVKCHNPECSEKVDMRYQMLINDPDLNKVNSLVDFRNLYFEFLHWFTCDLLIIDRLNPEKSWNSEIEGPIVADNLIESLIEDDEVKYYENLKSLYNLSDLQESMLDLNWKSSFIAIRKYLLTKQFI